MSASECPASQQGFALNTVVSVNSAGNGRSHSRQMRPNIGLGDEILP